MTLTLQNNAAGLTAKLTGMNAAVDDSPSVTPISQRDVKLQSPLPSKVCRTNDPIGIFWDMEVSRNRSSAKIVADELVALAECPCTAPYKRFQRRRCH